MPAPSLSAYRARNTMNAVIPNRMMGAPRKAAHNRSASNALPPTRRMNPKPAFGGSRTGMFVSNTATNTGGRKVGVHSASSAATNAKRYAERKPHHRMSTCVHQYGYINRSSSSRTRCEATRVRSDSAATHSGFVRISTLACAPLRSGRLPRALLASASSAMRTGNRCGSRSQPLADCTSGRVPAGASPPRVTPQPTLSTLPVEHAARQQVERHAHRVARRDLAELVFA